jgi:hypothetical protein
VGREKKERESDLVLHERKREAPKTPGEGFTVEGGGALIPHYICIHFSFHLHAHFEAAASKRAGVSVGDTKRVAAILASSCFIMSICRFLLFL